MRPRHFAPAIRFLSPITVISFWLYILFWKSCSTNRNALEFDSRGGSVSLTGDFIPMQMVWQLHFSSFGESMFYLCAITSLDQ